MQCMSWQFLLGLLVGRWDRMRRPGKRRRSTGPPQQEQYNAWSRTHRRAQIRQCRQLLDRREERQIERAGRQPAGEALWSRPNRLADCWDEPSGGER